MYWFGGALAALSALLEKKNRRSELALYVLPRAADSLWYILVNRHLLPNIRHAEVALFCLCMGGIMYFHEHEPDTMAPFLRGLIKRFLYRGPTSDQPSLNSTLYPYTQTLVGPLPSSTLGEASGPQQKLEESSSDSHLDVSEKLKAEAFQGL